MAVPILKVPALRKLLDRSWPNLVHQTTSWQSPNTQREVLGISQGAYPMWWVVAPCVISFFYLNTPTAKTDHATKTRDTPNGAFSHTHDPFGFPVAHRKRLHPIAPPKPQILRPAMYLQWGWFGSAPTRCVRQLRNHELRRRTSAWPFRLYRPKCQSSPRTPLINPQIP